jgi:hypothetical protein
VPDRRPRNRGSFESHFDELVVQFRDAPPIGENKPPTHRSKRLQERIDVHGLLFRRAWALDDDGF